MPEALKATPPINVPVTKLDALGPVEVDAKTSIRNTV